MAAQREDGYFGSEENRGGGPENMQLGAAGRLKGPDLWPHMPMIDALKSYHEATGDERVIGFLTRYFKWQASLPKDQLLPGSWQKIRGGDNLESVLWLYNRTGKLWSVATSPRSTTHRATESHGSILMARSTQHLAMDWQVRITRSLR